MKNHAINNQDSKASTYLFWTVECLVLGIIGLNFISGVYFNAYKPYPIIGLSIGFHLLSLLFARLAFIPEKRSKRFYLALFVFINIVVFGYNLLVYLLLKDGSLGKMFGG